MKSKLKHQYRLLGVIALVQAVLLSLLQFTAWPEMILWPYLMLNGWLPYRDIAIAHTPLLITSLSLFYGLFGVGLLQLRAFTMLIITATTALIFLSSAKSKYVLPGVVAATSFIALNIVYDGNGLWFDSLLAPLALATYLLLTSKRYFLAGAAFALMLATKQTAFWFAPVVIFVLFTHSNRIASIKQTILGFTLVSIVFVLLLGIFGILNDFWKWAVEFGVFTLPLSQGQVSPPALKQIVFALLPFTILVVSKKKSFAIWAIAGAMGAFPRFELFHFQPALPFLALAAGSAYTGKKQKTIATLYLGALLLALSIYSLKNINKPARFFDTDTAAISKYLDENTYAGQKVYIINDWDHIYALSNTLPAARPWVPHLPWYMELPGIQEEIVKGLKSEKPEYIIHRPFENTGLSSYQPEQIVNHIYENYPEQIHFKGRTLRELP